MTGEAGGQEDETRKERVDRELLELLNELRVALPGVQVLFAFLLAVPFAQGWTKVTEFQKEVFFVTLCSTAVSAAFLIAPSAYHRIHFRKHEKERLLVTANKFMITGLLFLALSMVGVVVLIASVLYSGTVTIVSGVFAALLFLGLWVFLPLSRRGENN
jgi:hypothetical protein